MGLLAAITAYDFPLSNLFAELLVHWPIFNLKVTDTGQVSHFLWIPAVRVLINCVLFQCISLLLHCHISGSSQICSSSVSRGLAITGNIDVQVDISMPDPVCIRFV